MVKKGHKKHSSKSSSDCLTSESRRSSKSSRSSSSSNEENIVINVKHRHNGKKHKEIDCYKDKKDCNTTDNKECDTTDNKEKKHKHRRHKKGSKPKRKCHKKSSKSSSSSSSSEKPKHRRHKKSSKSSCSSSSSEKPKHRRHKKRSHSSSKSCSSSKSSSSRSCSSKSEKNRFCFNDIYNYYKQKLVCDEKLMVYGSNAYINLYSNTTSVLPTYDPVEFDATAINYNIEYNYIGSPTVVRESGIYVVFYSINADQSSQFSIFINGKYEDFSSAGNNSGAGQALARSLLLLNKNDTVLIRNYISSSNIIKSQSNAGGLINGSNMTYVLFKIAPLPCQPERKCIKYESSESSDSECTESKEKKECEEKKEWSVSCLSEKKKYLFKKLLDNMLLDPELMLKGFDVRGTFFSTNIQSVVTEADIVFDNQLNVNKLTFNNLNPTQVTINEAGIYKVFFYGTTNTAVQMAFTVNGMPVNHTIQGTNKGAGQVSLRAILQLNANDYLTVRNHTSANGSIVFSSDAGGSLASISGILTVFKYGGVNCVQCRIPAHLFVAT